MGGGVTHGVGEGVWRGGSRGDGVKTDGVAGVNVIEVDPNVVTVV